MDEAAFSDFQSFAPAFAPLPGTESVGAYLILLNLMEGSSEAVLVVSRCLDLATDKGDEIRNLLLSHLGWRPQLVGCVAMLTAEPQQRPADALVDAACRPSWVSPQILVTAALTDPPAWQPAVERAIIDRQNAKAAAALAALKPECSTGIVDLARNDQEGGEAIALRWRDRITEVFDEARVPRSW